MISERTCTKSKEIVIPMIFISSDIHTRSSRLQLPNVFTLGLNHSLHTRPGSTADTLDVVLVHVVPAPPYVSLQRLKVWVRDIAHLGLQTRPGREVPRDEVG